MHRNTYIATALALIAVLCIAFLFINEGGGEAENGATALAFKVTFKDGTSRTFQSNRIYTGKLEVIPFSLYVGGQEIASIEIAVNVRLNTGGRTVYSWETQTTQRIEIYRVGESVPLTSSTAYYPNSGTSWSNGETKTVSHTLLTAQLVENAIQQYSGDGDFYFQAVAQVTLTTNTNDGTYILAGSAVGGISITMINYGVIEMFVTVVVSPLSMVKA